MPYLICFQVLFPVLFWQSLYFLFYSQNLLFTCNIYIIAPVATTCSHLPKDRVGARIITVLVCGLRTTCQMPVLTQLHMCGPCRSLYVHIEVLNFNYSLRRSTGALIYTRKLGIRCWMTYSMCIIMHSNIICYGVLLIHVRTFLLDVHQVLVFLHCRMYAL